MKSLDLLGIKDVARMLHVGRHDVMRYVRAELLPFVRLPGKKHLRFTLESVEAFIRCHESRSFCGPIEISSTSQTIEFQSTMDKDGKPRKLRQAQLHERFR